MGLRVGGAKLVSREAGQARPAKDIAWLKLSGQKEPPKIRSGRGRNIGLKSGSTRKGGVPSREPAPGEGELHAEAVIAATYIFLKNKVMQKAGTAG